MYDVNDVPMIGDFTSYHAFIKARFEFLRINQPTFSHRKFAKAAGFGSPNYAHLVMNGKRNLTADSAIKFATGLQLDEQETVQFLLMVWTASTVKFNKDWSPVASQLDLVNARLANIEQRLN